MNGCGEVNRKKLLGIVRTLLLLKGITTVLVLQQGALLFGNTWWHNQHVCHIVNMPLLSALVTRGIQLPRRLSTAGNSTLQVLNGTDCTERSLRSRSRRNGYINVINATTLNTYFLSCGDHFSSLLASTEIRVLVCNKTRKWRCMHWIQLLSCKD
jgi:hypothetical protein